MVEDLNMLNISPCMLYGGNLSSIFSINSGANALKLLENIEEMDDV